MIHTTCRLSSFLGFYSVQRRCRRGIRYC